jgi:hypothetical protein
MDPWLEKSWGGVHACLITGLQSQLAGQLPEDLYVALDETVYDFNQDDEEPIEEAFIEIRQLSEGNPLVTALEVLSPTNKSTAIGKRAYLLKRQAYRQAKANLVEIDLLRAGDPLLEAPLENLIRDHPRLACPYRCNIRRYREAEAAVDIRPISLRDRLPRIQIPLRANDPAVFIDLQQPIDLVYQLGSYGRRIDYTKPPTPPLSPEDAEWAAAMLRQAV